MRGELYRTTMMLQICTTQLFLIFDIVQNLRFFNVLATKKLFDTSTGASKHSGLLSDLRADLFKI